MAPQKGQGNEYESMGLPQWRQQKSPRRVAAAGRTTSQMTEPQVPFEQRL